MTWLLYEVARHPEYQGKMREEIQAARARVVDRGESDFTTADLESMRYLNAFIKVRIFIVRGLVHAHAYCRKPYASTRSFTTCPGSSIATTSCHYLSLSRLHRGKSSLNFPSGTARNLSSPSVRTTGK